MAKKTKTDIEKFDSKEATNFILEISDTAYLLYLQGRIDGAQHLADEVFACKHRKVKK